MPLPSNPDPRKPEQEMKKTRRPLILILVILLLIGGLFVKLRQQNSLSNSSSSLNYATLKIDNGESIDISDYVGKTALEATQGKVSVTLNGSGANAFVTGINGRQADSKKKEFWEFDINGTESDVGAGSYIIQNHDQIEWKIANY